jgi:eukaryotic-like serine/threonine-protein kinase
MTPTKWDQLKAMFGVKLSKRFRQAGSAVERGQAVGSQSETQTDDPMASGKSTVDYLGPPIMPAPYRPLPRKAFHSLTFGQIVAGRFEILRFINSGGMGEVYEAWDSELRERIALKTIRPEIASSPSVIERFKREVKQARVISQVNVCRVYEVFSHTQASGDRIWFLTMELLEGQTLSELLRQQGSLPTKRALELIEQMVAGLAAAHDLGIVHRDFKSSNVMLVDPGAGRTRVVITDFGLALNVLTKGYANLRTSGGGTPQYMAPEQEREAQVGLPADQYALGVVICEMLTGRLPSRPDSTGKVLLPPVHLSPRWEAVIGRCLEFRPEDRFKDVRDVVSALKPRRRSKSAWIAGAAIALTAMVFIAALLIEGGHVGSRLEGVVQLTPATDLSRHPSLSRDGKVVAYSSDRAEAGNLDIWVQHLPSGKPVRITRDPAEDGEANIAPDGNAVVFRSERNGGGIYLAKVPWGGERLLVPDGRDPRLSPDGGSVVYWAGDRDATVASGQLFLLSLADGSSVRLVPDFADARFPVWSFDGRYILFTGCRTGDQPLPACSEWWVTSRDGKTVQNTGSLALLRKKQILPIDVGGWYRDTILFGGRQGATTSLWELPILEATLQASGEPQQLTQGDAREVAASLADNGTISFEHFTGALHVWSIDHASNPKGVEATKVTQDAAVDISPNISPNGRWLAFSRGFGSRRDIWIKDMRSGTESLFLSSELDKFSPVVDDSGETVAFEGRDLDGPSLFILTRGQPAKRLCSGCSNPTGWFDGDRGVLYRDDVPSKIKMVDPRTKEVKIVLEADSTSLNDASWSPENQYLLFTASRDGRTKQVFAVLFPKSTQVVSGEWIPITSESEFSERPRWSGDGKSVFYLSTRDGFSCVWGQRFDVQSGRVTSKPFAVMHYHNPRFSPGRVASRSFNLSVSGDSIYLNVGETNSSIWTGVLKRRVFFPFFERFR